MSSPMSTTARLAVLVTVLVALAVPTAAVADRDSATTDLAAARAATATFHRTDAAAGAGFGAFPAGVPLHECISALDEHAAMGIHWLHPGRLDTHLDPAEPEVLVYEPVANGRLRLVALEYVVFADAWAAEHGDTTPQLFGRDLTYVGEPNRYEIPAFWQLHAWVFKANPHGMFADHNPRVTCEFG